jgi:hypothetical protein
MKATELRINNWYNSVKWGIPVRCELTDFTQLDVMSDGAYDDPPIEYMFEPIPLTEEWLLKFGFEIKYDGEFAKDYKFKNLKVRHKKQTLIYIVAIWDEDDNDCAIIYLDYVHQLQNLYFALTGEELKIKKL